MGPDTLLQFLHQHKDILNVIVESVATFHAILHYGLKTDGFDIEMSLD